MTLVTLHREQTRCAVNPAAVRWVRPHQIVGHPEQPACAVFLYEEPAPLIVRGTLAEVRAVLEGRSRVWEEPESPAETAAMRGPR